MLEGQYFHLDDISELEPFFWMACVYCFFTYPSIMVPIMMMPRMLTVEFLWGEIEAGIIFTIPYIVSALISPVIGWYVDRYGNRMTISIIGSFFLFMSHVSLLFMLTIDDDNCDKCYLSAFLP